MPDPLKKLRAALAAHPYPFLAPGRSKRRAQSSIEKAAAGAVGWVVFPLKYADYFLEMASQSHRIASSCYYIGRKA